MNPKKNERNPINITPIGVVKANDTNTEFWIEIHKQYRPALKELEHYSHVNILWWANQVDTPELREIVEVTKDKFPPFYGKQVPNMGIFATRSEVRPNPIGITASSMIRVDVEKGIIQVPWMDAFPGSPVIDIKPYIGMSDRVEEAKNPSYLQHWPNSLEKAAVWFAEMMAEGKM